MILNNNSIPLMMGIANGTPDSFYHNNKIDFNENFPINKYKYADIIDFGFESSRPGAKPLSFELEHSRLNKLLNILPSSDKIYSIDTYKPTIARIALNNGFSMINDIKAGNNDNLMFQVASEYGCPIVLMHMQGIPETMQNNPHYINIMDELLLFFEKKIKIAEDKGILRENIIIDPGIGFGKTMVDNYIIINNLNLLKTFRTKILVGLSRKSFLTINDDKPKSRLASTLASTVLAIQNGADIIRVHDIEDSYKLIMTLDRFRKNNSQNNLQHT